MLLVGFYRNSFCGNYVDQSNALFYWFFISVQFEVLGGCQFGGGNELDKEYFSKSI